MNFEERFTRLRSIGKGSFGEVWASLDMKCFCEVAIKSQDISETYIRTAVERELEILRTVRHPNVVRMLDTSVVDATAQIVMERGDMTLSAYLHRHGVMNTKTALEIVQGIGAGLAELHAHGYVHTDLKMENVVMFGSVPKIIDFGCARRATDFTTEFTGTMGDTPYLTTRWYRAPEMILGIVDEMGPAMDVWALGCVAFTLVTGRILFPGTNEEDMLAWMDFVLGPLPDAMIDRAVNQPGLFFEEDVEVHATTFLVAPHAPGELYARTIASLASIAKRTVTHTKLGSRYDGRLLFSRVSPMSRVHLCDLVRDPRYLDMMLKMLSYEPSARLCSS